MKKIVFCSVFFALMLSLSSFSSRLTNKPEVVSFCINGTTRTLQLTWQYNNPNNGLFQVTIVNESRAIVGPTYNNFYSVSTTISNNQIIVPGELIGFQVSCDGVDSDEYFIGVPPLGEEEYCSGQN
jgi:hypothetical protein